MKEIQPKEAAEVMTAGKAVLIDVREADELQAAAVDGAVHMPMSEFAERIDELEKEQPYLVMCHLGGRSAHVGAYMEQQGFTDVTNVAGGIQGWADTYDKSVVK